MLNRRSAMKRAMRLSPGAMVESLEFRRMLSATPIGPETRVNTTTGNVQRNSTVAMNASGDYIVVWESLQNGTDYDIYAQRYSAWGGKVGAQFRVNTTVAGDQTYPGVAMNDNGDFVITWQGNPTGADQDIYARRFNSAGVALGNDFLVNTTTSDSQNFPVIGMDSAGDFAITWQSSYIMMQVFNGAGKKISSEVRVNTDTLASYTAPNLAMNSSGDIVVSYQSFDFISLGGQIYAYRFNLIGAPQGDRITANTYQFGAHYSSDIAIDPSGNFTIVWGTADQDLSGSGIYGQRFNAAGVPLGSEFRVNATTVGDQLRPSVAMDSAGNFVVAWEGISPTPGNDRDIFAQMFNSQGEIEGTEMAVNTLTTGVQLGAQVARDAAGNFIIVWNGDNLAGAIEVYSQLYANKSDYVGVQRGGSFYLDSNHSDNYEGGVTTADDTLTTFGASGDKALVGDWNGDGFDDIGIWRAGFFYLDANGNGTYDGSVTDRYFSFGLTTDTPIVGDWNGDGIDDVGVWRAGKFYVDLNGNRTFDANDGTWTFGVGTDTPIIGDWNGDGRDDIGVWRAGLFYLDLNGNHKWDRTPADRVSEFGLATDKPIVGDWNGDGKDEIGVRRLSRFWIDGNANGKWDGAVDDYFVDFGNSTDVPLVGFWRPRAVPGNPPAAPSGLVISAAASEVVSSPTVTSSQMDSGVTKKGEVSTVKDAARTAGPRETRHEKVVSRKRQAEPVSHVKG